MKLYLNKISVCFALVCSVQLYIAQADTKLHLPAVRGDIEGAALAKSIEQHELAMRKKYANKQLSYYRVSYQGLINHIKTATKRVFGNVEGAYSQGDLFKAFFRHEQELIALLHQSGEKAYGKIALSRQDLDKRIDEHETKLLRKFGSTHQLDYYNVNYGEFEDIVINASKRLLRREERYAYTTEAQLQDLFNEHEDVVVEELNKRRSASFPLWKQWYYRR